MVERNYLSFELDEEEIKHYNDNLEEILDEDVGGRRGNLYDRINDYLDSGIRSQNDLNAFIDDLSDQSVGVAGGNVTLHKSMREMAIQAFEEAYEMLD